MLTKYKSIFVILLLLINTQVQAKHNKPEHHKMVGTASWYGPRFHGKKTSSGEKFNQNKLTASHKTLPFGTKVRVTNLDNNKSVVVTINDRGPFVRGRVIDLSRYAANQIGIKGLQKVSMKIIS